MAAWITIKIKAQTADVLPKHRFHYDRTWIVFRTNDEELAVKTFHSLIQQLSEIEAFR